LAHSDTATVRQGEEINLQALAAYLRGKIEGAERGVQVEQFPHGHSNLTYLLRAGDREYVLRRGPLGPVAPKAHDMAREFRVLQAVHPHFPEAPEPYLLCEDPAILGAVFFLMERRKGIVLREPSPRELAGVAGAPSIVSEAFVDCMVRMHRIDVASTGIAALGKPEGFVARQVQSWAERWQRSKTEELPDMDRVIDRLAARTPASIPPTLVHNDFKLDNVMLRANSLDRVEAVLDWEMTTVGDPLADVGLTLCYWSWASAPQLGAMMVPTITSQPGWYTRERFIQHYAKSTGRDVSQIGYYEVLGIFKLAVIVQQIFYRFARGQTQDQRFRNFDQRVKGLAHLAATVAEKYC